MSKLKVRVTPDGARYVTVADLLARKETKEQLKLAADLAANVTRIRDRKRRKKNQQAEAVLEGADS